MSDYPFTMKAEAEIARLRAEIADLKVSVVAFCGPWAAQYGKDAGWPTGHLHPAHYDLLEQCGARMIDFTRAALEAKP
jgi:hypothetical protein